MLSTCGCSHPKAALSQLHILLIDSHSALAVLSCRWLKPSTKKNENGAI